MKKITLILAVIMLFSLVGCGKSTPGIIDGFDIRIDGKPADIDLTDGMSIYYSGDNSIEVTNSDESCDYIDGELSVKGIKLGSGLDEVVEALGLEPGYAEFDYEYDPYGDGCTEIGTAIFDGTMIDLFGLHVLDANLQTAYYEKDGEWIMIDRREKELSDFDSVVILSVDFNGVCELYGDEPGIVCSLAVRLFSSEND